jgi:hypothetical protein
VNAIKEKIETHPVSDELYPRKSTMNSPSKDPVRSSPELDYAPPWAREPAARESARDPMRPVLGEPVALPAEQRAENKLVSWANRNPGEGTSARSILNWFPNRRQAFRMFGRPCCAWGLSAPLQRLSPPQWCCCLIPSKPSIAPLRSTQRHLR